MDKVEICAKRPGVVSKLGTTKNSLPTARLSLMSYRGLVGK